MEMLGEPPLDVLKKSSRAHLFFDPDGNPIIKANSRGKKRYPGTKNMATFLNCADFTFLEFIGKCLDWNPKTRMKP